MKKVLVIVGPTGVGKSKLSIELAKTYSGEIISGDAYQCYKELNIGSAKTRSEEMQGIPHYLVDNVSYKEEYNVKLFQEKARDAINEINEHNHLPIVCGGTGLYVKSLLYDYQFHEEEIDQSYADILAIKSNEELFDMLIEEDQETSTQLHPNNRKRVLRALMMAHLGHKKSEVIEQQEHALLYDVFIIGLTLDRQRLYERIDCRVEQMVEDGLQNEVLGLITKVEDFTLQSLQGIGYKEWLGFYQKEKTLEETVQLIQKNTRNFAKRQYTWFRNQMDIHWYDIEEESYLDDIKKDIHHWLNK